MILDFASSERKSPEAAGKIFLYTKIHLAANRGLPSMCSEVPPEKAHWLSDELVL